MNDSSDEEIIIRKQKGSANSRIRNLGELFDEKEEAIPEYSDYESEELDEYIPKISNSTLRAVFGTGKEYSHMLETVEQSISDEIVSLEKEEVFKTTKICDHQELFAYVRNNTFLDIKDENLIEFIEMLESGVSLQFIMLHTFNTNCMSIYEAYQIVDLINECKTQPAKLTHLAENYEKDGKILKMSQFLENLITGECVHEPKNDEKSVKDLMEFENQDENRIIPQIAMSISSNILFRKVIFNFFKESGSIVYSSEIIKFSDFIDLGITSGYETVLDEDIIIPKIIKAYSINDESDWHTFRVKIISLACINLKGIIKSTVDGRVIEHSKEILFNNILDRVVNGRIIIESIDSTFLIALFDTKGLKIQVVNNLGQLIEENKVNLRDCDEIMQIISKYEANNLYVTSDGYQTKFVLKRLKSSFPNINLIYLESKYAKKFCNIEDLSLQVMRTAMFPEVEYTKYNEKQIFIEMSGIENLNEDDKRIVTERGIQTALAIVGIDVNNLIHNPYFHPLLKYIPEFVINSKLNSYGFIERLEIIKKKGILDDLKFKNAVVFLRIFSKIHSQKGDFDILDSLSIHYDHYKYARMICAAAFDKEEIDEENPSKIVEEALFSKEILSRVDISQFKENIDIYPIFKYVISILSSTTQLFDGCTDEIIFYDSIKEVDMECEYEGITINVTPRSILVSVEDRFVVYARIEMNDEFFLNQIVKVKLISKSYENLSFEGAVIFNSSKKELQPQFWSHPYFKNLGGEESICYLTKENQDFLIRPSSLENTCVLVLRVFSDVYLQLRIIEQEDFQYILNKRTYEDLDDVISIFVRNFYLMLKNVQGHPKFFDNESSAHHYLSRFDDTQIFYSFYLSFDYPGVVVFAYNDGAIHKECIKIRDKFEYDQRRFESIDAFIVYRKNKSKQA